MINTIDAQKIEKLISELETIFSKEYTDNDRKYNQKCNNDFKRMEE